MTGLTQSPYSLIRPYYEKTQFHNAVIDELEDHNLRKAYRQCREITRYYARTFYLAARFLPFRKQRSIFAIYALCRYLDNLVDESVDLNIGQKLTPADIMDRLTSFQRELMETCFDDKPSGLILTAFSDVLKQFRISPGIPLELMEGIMMDLTKMRYKNFEELYNYSYKVAGVVGLMTSEVFGYREREALQRAVDLGIAMQLTNIIRDIGEDLARGRIYLPQDELHAFGVTESDLMEGNRNGKFINLIRFQIDRARRYYRKADRGIPMLTRDSRLPVYLARENYSRILDKVEDNDYNVFDSRAFLTMPEKLTMVPRILCRMHFDTSETD